MPSSSWRAIPEQRKRFGAAARKRVEKEFSIDKCVKAHADLYEEMLDKDRG